MLNEYIADMGGVEKALGVLKVGPGPVQNPSRPPVVRQADQDRY